MAGGRHSCGIGGDGASVGTDRAGRSDIEIVFVESDIVSRVHGSGGDGEGRIGVVVVTKNPTRDVDRAAGGVVELDGVHVGSAGVGEDFVDHDASVRTGA